MDLFKDNTEETSEILFKFSLPLNLWFTVKLKSGFQAALDQGTTGVQ